MNRPRWHRWIGRTRLRDLFDAPDSYEGQAAKILAVDADENVLELVTDQTGGGGGSSSARHSETFTSTSPKTITHNLGAYPAVTVLDSSLNEITVAVSHTDTNELVLSGWAGTLTGAIVICQVSGSRKQTTFTSTSPYTFVHSLGAYPAITVLDSSLNEITVRVTHTDTNNASLSGWSGSLTNAIAIGNV